MLSLINNSQNDLPIRPMSPLTAGAWFAAFGLATFLGFHIVLPRTSQTGLSEAEGLILVLIIPLALMLVAATIMYQREGHEMTLRAIMQHWRYPRIKISDFLWAIVIILIASFASGLMTGLATRLIEAGLISIPSYVPALFNPLADLQDVATWDKFVGGSIRGNWSIIALYFTLLFFNIVGEEVLWRGYILPQQEAYHGRAAWLIHGSMWTAFHAFNWWSLLNLLPICLILSYVSQRTGRNWPAFIAHYFINGLGFIVALSFAAGWL